ncbi:isochorismatase family protein [Gluconacetobacter azotocaptans]|nr:isochorismatase family protein [Gluconacetobacter azotocaptans]GBQ35937.1 isochorismatase hydrolase [Gluconacetobacter azotocaptans DSM 13594]
MKALAIIDMQMDMQHRIEAGRDHVNPASPVRIAELAAAFRRKGLPVLHIRHADENRASPLHPEAAGYRPMPCAEALENEPVFVKRTSSGFASTDLAVYLRDKGIDDLFVTGAVAGFCVNSTVRAGADLGFNMTVVRDAVLGFDMPSAHLSARTIFDVTMALLEADFAKVVDSTAVLPD